MSVLEDNYEKAQTKLGSVEAVLALGRKKHDNAIEELGLNSQNSSAEIREHARLLEDRNAELKVSREEINLPRTRGDEGGPGPDNAAIVRLELSNKELTERCT